ncbi:hypothetical protein C8K44_1176 [Aminobacter sp. AP02]|nr:hypothetical protein C8K44_1176 [Aminobacter sp. AP02]
MHYHRQFAGHGNGSPFEADALPELPQVRRLLSIELRVRMTTAAS